MTNISLREQTVSREMASLEEYGDKHDETCCVNLEEECDCTFFNEIRAALDRAFSAGIEEALQLNKIANV